jgi:hypothetical protein
MDSDLAVQFLAAPAEERRAAAKMLVKLATEPAVEALVALADNGPTLEDQLLAVRCLGETGSPRALTYLRSLCQERIVRIPTTYIVGRGENSCEVCCPDEEHICVNAQGPLRFALTYIVPLYEAAPGGQGVRRRPMADIVADRVSIPRARESFRIVWEALGKLSQERNEH